MPTFKTPVESWAWPTGSRLLDRLKVDRGVSVVKVNGHYQQQENPYLGDIENLTEGVDWFQGGRTYSITQSVADALTADGMGGGVTP